MRALPTGTRSNGLLLGHRTASVWPHGRRHVAPFTHALLALTLVLPPPTAAQAPFPIVPPTSIVVGPLLLLLIPWAVSSSDGSRIREMEAKGDWDGMASFASTRLDKQPEALQWHALRGHARQRQGRCAEAVVDLKRAFDGLAAQPGAKADAVFAAGLALGACEMALRDWTAAARTMTAIEGLAPARWEPAYNLGVIRALQGEQDAARATQERLAALNRGAARSLQVYRDACGGVEPSPRAAVDPTPPTRLTTGPRTIVLPPGRWVPVKSTPDTVSGSQRERGSFRDVAIPVTTLATHARDDDGRVEAAIAFGANATQAYGTSFWNVGDPCAASDTLHVERPNRRNERAECLSLRAVDAAPASLSPRLRPALQAALEGGASLPSAGYELHFARYEWDWIVDVTWLVPMCRLAGDLDAMAWLRTLAAQWPSMHPQSAPQVATMPPLGPARRSGGHP